MESMTSSGDPFFSERLIRPTGPGKPRHNLHVQRSRWYYPPPVKYCKAKTNVRAVLLVFLCPFFCAVRAHAQDDASPQLSMFEIPAGDLTSQSASLSPDGQQVVAVYFKELFKPGPADITVSLSLWKVGVPEPIASTQISVRPEDGEVADMHGHVGTAYVQYCNNGSSVMLADLDGTLRSLNPQTLELLHATTTNMTATTQYKLMINVRQMTAHCAARSPRAVVAVFGGIVGPAERFQFDHSVLVRVYDLSSGALVREWRMTDISFEDVAISPSGNEIAVSHRALNSRGLPGAPDNLELFDVNTGNSTLDVKIGSTPVRITFVEETQVATADEPHQFSPHPTIKLWDASNGKLVREFAAPRVGARRLVGASSDGNVILGYIPKETILKGGYDEASDRRFRLWDAASGQTIATSPPTYPQLTSDNCYACDPGLDLSASGNAVVVFAPWRGFTLPIYVFSLPSAGPPQPH